MSTPCLLVCSSAEVSEVHEKVAEMDAKARR